MIIDKVLGIVDVYKGTVVEGCQCFQMTQLRKTNSKVFSKNAVYTTTNN